jgi:RNA polymerase sigma-70 factor, ECF subfamily
LSVQQGQHELFYELVRPYEGRVYAAALAILRNEHDAEDAAQEAMLKAFANIRHFRAEARFSTWLIQITVNEALMRRRRGANCANGRHRWTSLRYGRRRK